MKSMLIVINFFFFNDTATTEIYTLSLHDALPICGRASGASSSRGSTSIVSKILSSAAVAARSEEHTSELQSRQYLVCRLLLEKKKISQSQSKLCYYKTNRNLLIINHKMHKTSCSI